MYSFPIFKKEDIKKLRKIKEEGWKRLVLDTLHLGVNSMNGRSSFDQDLILTENIIKRTSSVNCCGMELLEPFSFFSLREPFPHHTEGHDVRILQRAMELESYKSPNVPSE